jgi:hypothetical protein
MAGIQEKLRATLRATPLLYRALRSSRAIIHFGPWRRAARGIVRLLRPPRQYAVTSSSSIHGFDIPVIVETLRTEGILSIGLLRSDELSRIRAITDDLPPGEYGDFHEIHEVRALTEDAAAVARRYLQAEPELIECSLFVAHAENPSYQIAYDSDRQFHFEDAGWHSLSLFLYLTDVSEDSGARQVVVRTHRALTLWDAIRGSFPETEIQARYPQRISTIAGPAGTMFFEDTSAIHRRKIHKRRHVMLHILFVSRRCWASKGRPIRRYSEYLRARGVTRESP